MYQVYSRNLFFHNFTYHLQVLWFKYFFPASGLFLPLFAEISLFYLIIVHKLLCVSAESHIARLQYIGLMRNGKSLLCVLFHKKRCSPIPVYLLDDIKNLIYIDW